MDWSGSEPDPLVREFLPSDRLDELGDEAVICFFNTLGVVSGPYHLGLEGELTRARAWHEALAGSSGEKWAEDLVAHYQADIDFHRQRDDEERLRFR